MTRSFAGRGRGHGRAVERPAGPPPASDPPVRRDVVTCFLRHRAEVLLVRRSARVGSYRGRWGAVAGHVETEDPLLDARREVEEETGLGDAVTLVKRGAPFDVDDADSGRRWRVHPFLFDVSRRDAVLDWEAVEATWAPPTAILERSCVPRLWTSYAHVAPTLEAVRADREHGSAYLSLRALEALRDRAAADAAGVEAPGDEVPGAEVPGAEEPGAEEPGGEQTVGGGERVAAPSTGPAGPSPAEADALGGLARALREAQPAMTALRNRLDRAMSAARAATGGTVACGAEGEAGAWPRVVAAAAQDTLERALEAEEGVVAEAARLVAGRRVLTLSLSATVARALLAAEPSPERVVVAESRPGGEGRTLVGRLAARGIDVTLVPDAAVAWALERFRLDLALVGADTVLPGGDVVNKVGTRPLALAAWEAGVPCLAAAARDKIAAEGRSWDEAAAGEAADAECGAAPGPDPGVRERWRSPLFERTPAGLVGGIVTEAGVLDAAGVRRAAAEHGRRQGWDR